MISYFTNIFARVPEIESLISGDVIQPCNFPLNVKIVFLHFEMRHVYLSSIEQTSEQKNHFFYSFWFFKNEKDEQQQK